MCSPGNLVLFYHELAARSTRAAAVQDRFAWTITPGAVDILDLTHALLERVNATEMNVEAIAAGIQSLSAVGNRTIGGGDSLVSSYRRMATSTLDAVTSLVTAIKVGA
jgi:hypothetical protein